MNIREVQTGTRFIGKGMGDIGAAETYLSVLAVALFSPLIVREITVVCVTSVV